MVAFHQQDAPPASAPTFTAPRTREIHPVSPATSKRTASSTLVDEFFARESRPPIHTQNPEPSIAAREATDPKVMSAYGDAQAAWYNYLAEGYRFRMRAFERQLTLSLWIFVIVTLLVTAGVVFAGFQLFAGLFSRPKIMQEQAAAQAEGTEVPNGVTEIQLTATSFVVKTSILGVVVLTIACAFFFLYLKFVYPIQNTMW